MTHAHLHLAEDAEERITGRDLARHVGLSERQLRRRFHALYGESTGRYLAELRLQQAGTVTVTPPEPVTLTVSRPRHPESPTHQFTVTGN
jgi:transcriptional regulator GlxA family with amidase domain